MYLIIIILKRIKEWKLEILKDWKNERVRGWKGVRMYGLDVRMKGWRKGERLKGSNDVWIGCEDERMKKVRMRGWMNESKKSEHKERAHIRIRWFIKVSNLFVRAKQEKFASLLKFRHSYQREHCKKCYN